MNIIEYNIESEDSSDHWRYLQPKGKNVLDLGCGRWCSREGSWDNLVYEEFSPIYIGLSGAKKVIGIDASINEIEFFNKRSCNEEQFTFIHDTISSPEQIKYLINEYNINCIKCDIEGSEIQFFPFTKDDFSHIDMFAVEYHTDAIKDIFYEKLPQWGFNITAHGKMWIGGMGVIFAAK
jgi:hypothetical protein